MLNVVDRAVRKVGATTILGDVGAFAHRHAVPEEGNMR